MKGPLKACLHMQQGNRRAGIGKSLGNWGGDWERERNEIIGTEQVIGDAPGKESRLSTSGLDRRKEKEKCDNL